MTQDRRISMIIIIAGALLLLGASAWIWKGNSATETIDSLPGYVTREAGEYFAMPRVMLPLAKEAFDQGQAIFVDTRPVEFYQQSHIPGAINMPDETIPEAILVVPRETRIITYCT